jgi:putative FmdB family regulatory protein
MPIFDFRCRGCGHAFEALVRTGDTPACPSCRSQDLERLLSSFAVNYAEKTAAAAKDSRKRQIAARKDAIVAEEEYREKHDKGLD